MGTPQGRQRVRLELRPGGTGKLAAQDLSVAD